MNTNPKITVFDERAYFSNDSGKLRDIECPNCNSVNCLFRSFLYVGCSECGNYFSEEDFL